MSLAIMDEFTENYVAENSALRRKLQSKAEALLILSQELEQCRVERDQFKLMAEQIQDRYSKLKKMCPDLVQGLGYGSSHLPGRSITELVEELHERNKSLILEQEDLKQKLRDAHGDMKVLRAGLQQRAGGGDISTVPSHQREELVQQLEVASARSTQLQADVQSLLDEKEELVTQRDAYRCKVHRLNHQLSTLLRADSSQMIDIDALIMENKYLQERLEQAQEERELSQQALLKYKGMLDKKRNKGSVRLGTNGTGNGMVVSHKQVQQLLQDGTAGQMPNTEATLADLRSLCLALLEALQDKSLALSHQKKSNKILASRVHELEQRLESVGDVCVPPFPSQLLLNGYSGSQVDKDLQDMPDSCSGGAETTVHSDGELTLKDAETESISEQRGGIIYDLNEAEEDRLPPRLQELVQSALQDIENEKSSSVLLPRPQPITTRV